MQVSAWTSTCSPLRTTSAAAHPSVLSPHVAQSVLRLMGGVPFRLGAYVARVEASASRRYRDVARGTREIGVDNPRPSSRDPRTIEGHPRRVALPGGRNPGRR